jgi:type II secretory pathway pseudopilin PulG
MTLLELVVACAILMVLATVALPIQRVTLVRNREATLHYDLRQMRDAIDRYKDASDKNLIKVAAGTEGYPPDLQTLVKGVQLASAADRHVRFLRDSGGSYDRDNRLGAALRAGRSGFELLGKARTFSIFTPNPPEWDWTVQNTRIGSSSF